MQKAAGKLPVMPAHALGRLSRVACQASHAASPQPNCDAAGAASLTAWHERDAELAHCKGRLWQRQHDWALNNVQPQSKSTSLNSEVRLRGF